MILRWSVRHGLLQRRRADLRRAEHGQGRVAGAGDARALRALPLGAVQPRRREARRHLQQPPGHRALGPQEAQENGPQVLPPFLVIV